MCKEFHKIMQSTTRQQTKTFEKFQQLHLGLFRDFKKIQDFKKQKTRVIVFLRSPEKF